MAIKEKLSSDEWSILEKATFLVFHAVAPPLVITKEEIDWAVEKFKQVFK